MKIDPELKDDDGNVIGKIVDVKPELVLPGSVEYKIAVDFVVPSGALAKGPRNVPKPSERKRRRREVGKSRRGNR